MINAIERSELIDGLEDLGFELSKIGPDEERLDCVVYMFTGRDGYRVLVSDPNGEGIPGAGENVLITRTDHLGSTIDKVTAETLEGALAAARDAKELL